MCVACHCPFSTPALVYPEFLSMLMGVCVCVCVYVCVLSV